MMNRYIRPLRRIWEFFDYQCGKRLVALMRANMEVLQAEPEFAIEKSVAAKLIRISAPTVDRLLKPDRRRLQIRGRSRTRHGPLLKHQIPIRTDFSWDERHLGYFELDTVHHEVRKRTRGVLSHFNGYRCLLGMDRTACTAQSCPSLG